MKDEKTIPTMEGLATETKTEATQWLIDEGIPGNGARPEWLPEKFKSVADMAKSYKNLEKSFSTPPENYDFSKSKFLDKDYAPFQELQQLAKEKRVPQEVMDKFQESVDKYMGEFTVDPKEEIKKIGENAKERLQKLNNFVKAHLEEPQYNALMSNLNTADSILALEKLRNKFMTENTTIPTGKETTAGAETMKEIQSELNNNLAKYKTDAKYRAELQGRMAKVQSNYVDKVY